MDSQSILLFLNDFRTIVLVVICVMAYRASPFENKRLNFLFAYIAVAVISNIVALATRGDNNMFLTYIITPVHILMYTLLLMPDKSQGRTRLIVYSMMSIGLLLNFYEAFLIEGGTHMFNSIANTFISLFFGAMALLGLIKLRYDSSISNLASEPMFWILVGVALESIGTIITTAFYKTIQGQDANGMLVTMVIIAISVDYLANALYIVGFFKAKKKRPEQPKLAT